MHHYIPLTPEERQEMLAAIGVSSIEDLFQVIPKEIREQCAIEPRPGKSEIELRRLFGQWGREVRSNLDTPSFYGAGAYHHYIPSTVGAILGRGDFFSAYTPYQPEVSQGTLHAIFEFQSLVAAVIGLPVVNASMYDGASSTAEAILMAQRVTRRNKVIIAETLHPHYRAVVDTYTQFWELEKVTLPFDAQGTVDMTALTEALDDQTAAVVVQTPNFLGLVENLKPLSDLCKAKGALLVGVGPEPMAYGVYRAPGLDGADIFAGEGQSLGLPVNYGGPYVGLFGTRKAYIRQMPGRLCGQTIDENGKPGFVLTLSTREQHIRREKATSNICTNQGLCALAVAVYLSTVGRQGFQEIAKRNVQAASYLRDEISKLPGYKVPYKGAIFNEFVVETPVPVTELRSQLLQAGFAAGIDLHAYYPTRFNERTTLLCATELHSRETINDFVRALAQVRAAASV